MLSATALLCGLLLPAAPAAAGGRVEVAAGGDSNVTRAEVPAEQRETLAAQGIVEIENSSRPHRRVRIAGRYHAGARVFDGASGEDTLFQTLTGRATTRLVDWLILDAHLTARDRHTRAPVHPRDLTQISGGPSLTLVFGPVSTTFGSDLSRLEYAPDPEQSADGLTLHARSTLRSGALAFFATGRLTRRQAVGARRDRLTSGSTGVSYSGDWLLSAQYTVLEAAFEGTANTPDLFRHQVTVSGTAPLPLSLIASARVDIQRDLHDAPILLETGEIEDEGRSSVSFRLERPVVGELSAVGTAGAWFSPFKTGTGYSRTLLLAGLSWRTQ